MSIKEKSETRKKPDAPENKSMAVSNTSLQDLDLYVGEYILPGEGIEIKTLLSEIWSIETNIQDGTSRNSNCSEDMNLRSKE
ncbi:MAG: hypothetical protein IPO25_21680 [Saprospiraceae bacterium]|nr:hypothetical protein [Saprospiraceae bacterium]